MPILFQVENDAWKLQIVGRVPELPPFLTLAPCTRAEVSGAVSVSALNREKTRLEPIAVGEPIAPLLFENTDYDFYLETERGNTELLLPATATRRHEFKQVQHHALNFRNNVGFFEVIVKSDVTGTTTARFEVFPLKLDYRQDYKRMRDEVAAITRNLVMTVQARTFGSASAAPIENPTLVEWLSLARRYFGELVAAANAIARNPHSRLVKSVVSTPVDRSRKVDERKLGRQLRRPVSRVGANTKNFPMPLPERVPGVVSRLTFDTAENRYIKALLLETRKSLQKLIRTETTGDDDADFTAEQKFFAAARPDAIKMLRQVQVLLNAPYLREVTIAAPTRPSSLVLQQHPHYAAFARTSRLLNSGLALDGGLLQIGVKDIALLYEYWCFLKLVNLLSEGYTLEQQSLVKVKHTKITVTLEKGVEAAIKYRNRETGQELLLIYNRLFNRLPTVGQQPDNVIQIASENNLYIFDAKYRLAFTAQYQKQYGGIGPTVDDINTMHRYRDAIVLPNPTSKEKYITGIARGAVVLFPYSNEEAYTSHKFYRSISSIEIGGLPFLPGATKLVADKLQSLL